MRGAERAEGTDAVAGSELRSRRSRRNRSKDRIRTEEQKEHKQGTKTRSRGL